MLGGYLTVSNDLLILVTTPLDKSRENGLKWFLILPLRPLLVIVGCRTCLEAYGVYLF